jgi:plasmid maintenance system antidote protein VapI
MARKKTARMPRPLSDALRSEILRRNLTPGDVARLSGVDRSIVARFLLEQRDIRLSTADLIALAIGVSARAEGAA